MANKIGVLLMTYGSATTEDSVPEYLNRIYRGKAPEATIEEFKRRYRLIGRSPLVEITNSQAKLLQEKLGDDYLVRAGMRHSAPFIADALLELKNAGSTKIIGIILSPQFSSFIMQGYHTAFMDAGRNAGCTENQLVVAKPWPKESHFVELLTRNIHAALTEHGNMPIIFTTHSLPQKVVESDPTYLAQLTETIDAVRAQLPSDLEWYAAYQSAGHSPETWLTPDLKDVVQELSQKNTEKVLIVPIQFLSDHLEILCDLDIAAKQQCEETGIEYHRTSLPNTDPLFIETLAALVHSAGGI